jgi:hypothetical protein
MGSQCLDCQIHFAHLVVALVNVQPSL